MGFCRLQNILLSLFAFFKKVLKSLKPVFMHTLHVHNFFFFQEDISKLRRKIEKAKKPAEKISNGDDILNEEISEYKVDCCMLFLSGYIRMLFEIISGAKSRRTFRTTVLSSDE